LVVLPSRWVSTRVLNFSVDAFRRATIFSRHHDLRWLCRRVFSALLDRQAVSPGGGPATRREGRRELYSYPGEGCSLHSCPSPQGAHREYQTDDFCARVYHTLNLHPVLHASFYNCGSSLTIVDLPELYIVLSSSPMVGRGGLSPLRCTSVSFRNLCIMLS